MANDLEKGKSNLPAELMDDIFATAGQGVDYETSELQIPFVRVIQALSPQIKKNDPMFIKGASQGDAFNTVTGEYWKSDDGFEVVPCLQQTKYLEFIPRDQGGGGFIGELSADSPEVAKAVRTGGKEILLNGNELVKSDQHYCLLLGKDGMFQPVIIDMKSTQLKVSRRWKTQIAMQKIKAPDGTLKTPALFATVWKFHTLEESNDMGSWYNWSIEKVKTVDDKTLFLEAMSFRKSIEKGEAKAVAEADTEASKDDAPF